MPECSNQDAGRVSMDLLRRAARERASAVQIRIDASAEAKILFRVMGEMRVIESIDRHAADCVCAWMFQSVSDEPGRVFERLLPNRASLSDTGILPDGVSSISMATLPVAGGYVMHATISYASASSRMSLRDLGYGCEQIDAINYMTKRPSGIMVISGPPGSRKRDALAAVVTGLATDAAGRKNIVLVSRSGFKNIDGVVHASSVGGATIMQQHDAVAAALSIEPDILAVSSVCDRGVADAVLRAAMSGIQVWTTIQATSALSVFDRLRAYGVVEHALYDPTLLGGIIYQRSLQELCRSCCVPLRRVIGGLDKSTRRRIEASVNVDAANVTGPGCASCGGSGVAGVTIAAEVIVTDNHLMSLLRAGDRVGAIDYIRREQAWVPLLGHAIEKINAGGVDPLRAEEIVGAINAGVIERDHRVTREELR